MSKENTSKTKTRITLIGKFNKLHDEEYIARSFEMIDCEVQRIPEKALTHQITGIIKEFNPDFVLATKMFITEPDKVLSFLKENNIKSVSWNFDLYWGYPRQERIFRTPGFKCDYVFTTDNGHQKEWESIGINHQCIRQGIYKPECVLVEGKPEGVAFIGSFNSLYPYRQEMLRRVEKQFGLKWYGKDDTNELRGLELNNVFANTKVIVGDSVYSPNYWSNRVVETLGRGGFLIHQEVEGVKEEYPYLVTYKKGDLDDLCEKIKYYLEHEEERLEIVKKNFEWVRDNYTMDKKCKQLINNL